MARNVEKMDPLAPVNGLTDKLGIPEPSELLDEISPKTVARRLGVPTPDDLSDEMLADLRQMLRG